MLLNLFIVAFFCLISQIDSNEDLLPDVVQENGRKLENLKKVGVFRLLEEKKDPLSLCKKLGFHYVMMPPPITELEAPVFFDSPIHESIMEITNGGYAVLKNNPKFIYCQPRAERIPYLDLKRSLSKRFEGLNKAVGVGLKEVRSIQTHLGKLQQEVLGDFKKDTFSSIQKEWSLLLNYFPYEHQDQYLENINKYLIPLKKVKFHSLLSKQMLPFSFQDSILNTEYPEVIRKNTDLVDLLDQLEVTIQKILHQLNLTVFYLNEYDSILESKAYKTGFHNSQVKAPPKLLVTTVLKIKKAVANEQKAN